MAQECSSRPAGFVPHRRKGLRVCLKIFWRGGLVVVWGGGVKTNAGRPSTGTIPGVKPGFLGKWHLISKGVEMAPSHERWMTLRASTHLGNGEISTPARWRVSNLENLGGCNGDPLTVRWHKADKIRRRSSLCRTFPWGNSSLTCPYF